MAATTTITGAQFDAMPYEEGRQWELVDGDLISVSSPTPRHQDIVFEILLAVRRYLQQNKGSAGLAYQDVEFALTENDRVRPDVGVVLGEKSIRLNPDKVPIPGAPDIAIEVISPSERASESHDKVLAYLRKRNHGSVAGLPEIADGADPSRRGWPIPRMEPAGRDPSAARFRVATRSAFRLKQGSYPV
jgi:Uma2 family endonuclease